MIAGFQNIGKIPELKKRILFTLVMLAVYRLGCHIPTPGIDGAALSAFFSERQGTLFGLFDMFSGGALSQMSVMALGIMPYISSSIILELLTVVIPHLEKLKKEGEQGRKKITQYTRYGTVILSIVQGFGIAVGLERMSGPGGAMSLPRTRLPSARISGSIAYLDTVFSRNMAGLPDDDEPPFETAPCLPPVPDIVALNSAGFPAYWGSTRTHDPRIP